MSYQDLCSLEDDDCNELFITQSSNKSDNTASEIVEDDGILDLMNGYQFGVPNTNFGMPLISVVNSNAQGPVYEDISEDEFVDVCQDKGPNIG